MTSQLEQQFARALEEILVRVCSSRDVTSVGDIGVAFSGGLDSTALLCLLSDWAKNRSVKIHAIHIHHGLSANADGWEAHCEEQARSLGAAFHSSRVMVANRGEGIEASARTARYMVLGAHAKQKHLPLILTAHHVDDQAETVLLRLFRGTGVAGLSGMQQCFRAPALLGTDSVWLGRPLLDIERRELLAFAKLRNLCWVEDESNADATFVRNRLRHEVMGVIEAHFPGFQHRAARTAKHARDAQHILNEVAEEDLRRISRKQGLDIEALSQISIARFGNVIRHWFERCGVRMPSSAWLTELRAQILSAGEDARVRVVHPEREFWRYRNHLIMAPVLDTSILVAPPISFVWQGEVEIGVPTFGGALQFSEGEAGIDPSWLKGRVLTVRHRQGGEKIKLASNRPSRTLKQHYQALGVPSCLRVRLPIIEASGEVIFAAGVGINAKLVPLINDGGVQLHWREKSA